MVAYRGMKCATAAEKAHLARVRELPCCNCLFQESHTQAHHLLLGGKRMGHFFVIPLCELCHEHVAALRNRVRRMWEETMAKLGVKGVEWPVSKIVARGAA